MKGINKVLIGCVILLCVTGVVSVYLYKTKGKESAANKKDLGYAPVTEAYSIPSPITAYVTSIDGGTITLDYFDLLGGEDAKKAIVSDGRCTQEEVNEESCFNDGVVYFRNKSPQLRTFKVSSTTQIIIKSAFDKNPTGIVNISLSTFKHEYIDILDYQVTKAQSAPYVVSFNQNGEVSRVEEIFRP